MYAVRTPERDRLGAALDEAGIAHASHYTTPLHLQPALRYLGYSEGDLPETEKAARENLCLPLWGGISAEQQERVAAVLRQASTLVAGVIALPVTRHRLWQLLGDAVLIVLAWRLTFFLLFDQDVPRFYREFLSWQVVAVVLAINLVTFIVVRLLRALVALRLDARHVGRRARRHDRLAAHLPRALRVPARAHLEAAAPRRGDGLPAPAGARRRLAPARADAARAAAVGPRRARERGADRGRRQRRAAARPRDPAQPRARLHADRLRRRRPEEEEGQDPRRPRARHDRRAGADPAREPARTRC